jgi:tape measure domain-containing protein
MTERNAHLQLLVDGSSGLKAIKAMEEALAKLANKADAVQGSLNKLGARRGGAGGIPRVTQSQASAATAPLVQAEKDVTSAKGKEIIARLRREQSYQDSRIRMTRAAAKVEMDSVNATMAFRNRMNAQREREEKAVANRKAATDRVAAAATRTTTEAKIPASQMIGPRVETMADIQRQYRAEAKEARDLARVKREAANEQAKMDREARRAATEARQAQDRLERQARREARESKVPASQVIGPRQETMADIQRMQRAQDKVDRELANNRARDIRDFERNNKRAYDSAIRDAERRAKAEKKSRQESIIGPSSPAFVGPRMETPADRQRLAAEQARRQQLQNAQMPGLPAVANRRITFGSNQRPGLGLTPKMPDFSAASRSVSALSESFKRLEGSVMSVQGVLTSLGVGFVAKDILQTGMSFQNLDKGLEVATGSAIQGREEFKRLSAETDRLGLSTLGTGKEYVNFVAAVTGSTVNVEKAKETFFGVAQAMALLGRSPEGAQRAFKALEQFASKGQIQSEELKGQLAEQLPGAFALAAKALGMTSDELNKAMEKGKVSAQDLFNVFNDALRNKFPVDRIETASASFMRFQNAMDKAKRVVADGGFLQAAAEGADRLAQFLNSVDGKKLATELGVVLKDAVDLLIQGFQWLVENVDTVKTAFKVLIGIKIGGWILGVVSALAQMILTFKLLGATILGSALVGLPLLLAGGITALILMNKSVQDGSAAWADHAVKMRTIQQLHDQLKIAQGDERQAIKDKITALRDEAKAAVVAIQEQIDKRKELLALEQQANPGGPMSAFGPMQDQTAAYGLQDEGALNQSLKAAQDVVTSTTNVLEGKTPEGKRTRGSPSAGTSKGAATVQPVKIPPAQKVTGENIGEKFAQQKKELTESVAGQTALASSYALGTDAVEKQIRSMDILNKVQALNPKYSKAQVRELENLISALYDAEQATKFNEAVSGMDEARSQTIALTDATMALAHGTQGSSEAMIDEEARINARNAAISLGITHDEARVASLTDLYRAQARANRESVNAEAIKVINQSTEATNKETEALSLLGEKRAVVMATLEEEAKMISENIPLNTALAQERLKAAGEGALAENRNKGQAQFEDTKKEIAAIGLYSEAMNLNGDAHIRRNAEIAKMIELENAAMSSTDALGQALVRQAGDAAVAQEALERQKDALYDLANSGLTTTQQMRSLSYDGLMHMEDALVSLITGTKSVKEAFHDMAKAVANDLARMAVRQAITIPLAGMLGMGMPMMHGGGIVGKESTGPRMMPGSIPKAQRYHSGKMPGIGGGEVPTILNRNEGVFTPAQMASLGPAGGGTTSVFSPVIQVTQPKGATDAEGQTFGKAIVRQMQQMVDDRIGHAYRPGGIRNQSGM